MAATAKNTATANANEGLRGSITRQLPFQFLHTEILKIYTGTKNKRAEINLPINHLRL
jgi:hypothetical protein